MAKTSSAAGIVIEWIGYLHSQQLLQLEFAGGSTYEYSQVPPWMFYEMLESVSSDAYFSKHIKERFPFAKVA